jgi:hypothetical protein
LGSCVSCVLVNGQKACSMCYKSIAQKNE